VHTSMGGRWAVSAAALLGALAALPVWAQTESLEEVVVTARKRNEVVRDVPMPCTPERVWRAIQAGRDSGTQAQNGAVR